MSEHKAIYAELMLPYIMGTTLGVFIAVVGKVLESLVLGVSQILFYTGGFVGSAIMALALLELWDQRQIVGHEIENLRLKNLVLAASLEPSLPEVPEVTIPFPPLSFVRWLCDFSEEKQRLPTVDECEAHPYPRVRVNEWFKLLVDSGALVGRTERGASGDLAWSRERLETTAKRSYTAV